MSSSTARVIFRQVLTALSLVGVEPGHRRPKTVFKPFEETKYDDTADHMYPPS